MHAGVDRGTVCLHVADDGPGIPADSSVRVFEPGFSRHGGTGLGLWIVAATVRAHGGKVRCEHVRRGSRFVIDLPVLVAAEVA